MCCIVLLDEIGGIGFYLLLDFFGGVMGEVYFVDSGYNIMLMLCLDELKIYESVVD